MLCLIDARNGAEFTLARDGLIGRDYPTTGSLANFLCIPYPQISRRHAKVFWVNQQYYIVDLHSTNGTFLNGKRIPSGVMAPINEHTIINLGESAFYVRIEAQMDVTGKIAADNSSVALSQSASLSVVEGKHQPEVSMVMDASQIIDQLRGKAAYQSEVNQQAVTRLQAMIDISIALGELDDRQLLLKKITETVFEIFPRADYTAIILHDTKTGESVPLIAIDKQGNEERNLVISKTIVNEVLNNKKSLLLSDANQDSRFDAQKSVVDMSLKSVMCSPLLFGEQVLGFIQVDTRQAGYVFSESDVQVLTGLASQIAIAVKNSQLFAEIETLFEGFVKASVQAIEARDPSTAGHSFRVADYAEKLAMLVDGTDKHGLKKVEFNKRQIQELRYASLLHDFGKVGVREHVLTKARKLYPHELESIKQRFRYAKSTIESHLYKNLVEQHVTNRYSFTEFYAKKREIEAKLKQETQLLDDFMQKIITINEPQRLTEELEKHLAEIYQYRLVNHPASSPLISEFEFSLLGIAYGSLNPEERTEIESHVSHTFAFLKLIPWTSDLSAVPDIAHAHHERLDGSGYPRGLKQDDIPVQSKIMAIADIYDALTAGDRPYRQGVKSQHALDIIAEEVKKGKLDDALFRVFVDSECYRFDEF